MPKSGAGNAVRVILVTAPEKQAESIARTLLSERLIACANLLPKARSLYRWEGKIETDTEVVMIMKTAAANSRRLLKRLQALHPYKVPEFLTLKVEEGNAEYIRWVLEETQQ